MEKLSSFCLESWSFLSLICCSEHQRLVSWSNMFSILPSWLWYSDFSCLSAAYLIELEMLRWTLSFAWNLISGFPIIVDLRRPDFVLKGAPCPPRPKLRASWETIRVNHENSLKNPIPWFFSRFPFHVWTFLLNDQEGLSHFSQLF